MAKWLEESRIGFPCRAVTTPQFSLAVYEGERRFGPYANATSPLMAMYGYEMEAFIIENTLFERPGGKKPAGPQASEDKRPLHGNGFLRRHLRATDGYRYT